MLHPLLLLASSSRLPPSITLTTTHLLTHSLSLTSHTNLITHSHTLTSHTLNHITTHLLTHLLTHSLSLTLIHSYTLWSLITHSHTLTLIPSSLPHSHTLSSLITHSHTPTSHTLTLQALEGAWCTLWRRLGSFRCCLGSGVLCSVLVFFWFHPTFDHKNPLVIEPLGLANPPFHTLIRSYSLLLLVNPPWIKIIWSLCAGFITTSLWLSPNLAICLDRGCSSNSSQWNSHGKSLLLSDLSA